MEKCQRCKCKIEDEQGINVQDQYGRDLGIMCDGCSSSKLIEQFG